MEAGPAHSRPQQVTVEQTEVAGPDCAVGPGCRAGLPKGEEFAPPPLGHLGKSGDIFVTIWGRLEGMGATGV